MVRRVVAMVAAVLLMASYTFAQERGTVLGGVPFGTSPSEVAAAMTDLGLTAAVLKGGPPAFPLDQTFAGKIDGHQVLVVAMYDTREALEKLLVSFITSDSECLQFYRDFKLALTREFGDTHADVEDWKAPYDGGRHLGREVTAIRSGKGFVGATWGRDDMDGTAGMSLSVAGNMTVTLAYESAKWAQELDRRRKLLNATASGGSRQE
jgi:hypothetical protein